jgi:hypothetical protein
LVVLVSVTLATFSASALPVSGNLGLIGTYTSLERYDAGSATWVSANNLTAERINFADVDPGNAGIQLQIAGSTGDFAFENGLRATITSPFIFIPSTPYTPLWITLDGRFSFNLLQITETVRSSGFLFVAGSGFITDASGVYETTAANWDYSSQSGFTFSANTISVPEGGSTIAMLGLALFGMGALSTRFRQFARK